MPPADLYLLRHGQTEWSRQRRHTGRTDIPLEPEGREQARSAGQHLLTVRGGAPFALVLTSPLSRAAETAALAGFSAEAEPNLREWDYGAYEGITTAQIRAKRPDWSLWRDGCPDGEDASAVGERADAVLSRLQVVLGAGGAVLLVSHGHLLRVLAARWLGLPASDGRLLVLDAAGLAVLGHEHGAPAVRSWNLPTGPPPE